MNHYVRFDDDIATNLLGPLNYAKQNKNTNLKVNLTIKAVCMNFYLYNSGFRFLIYSVSDSSVVNAYVFWQIGRTWLTFWYRRIHLAAALFQ